MHPPPPAGPDYRAELHLLGHCVIRSSTDDQAEAILGQSKRLALLAYLAASPPAHRTRDRLLALFWPELDEASARHALAARAARLAQD